MKASPLEDVEMVPIIVKCFVVGTMSLGSIIQEAYETLVVSMSALSGCSNTIEGGEDLGDLVVWE